MRIFLDKFNGVSTLLYLSEKLIFQLRVTINEKVFGIRANSVLLKKSQENLFLISYLNWLTLHCTLKIQDILSEKSIVKFHHLLIFALSKDLFVRQMAEMCNLI